MHPVSVGYLNFLDDFSSISKSKILLILARKNISNACNLALVEAQSNLDGLEEVLTRLDQTGLLDEVKFQLVAKHTHLTELGRALTFLYNLNLLDETHFECTIQHADSEKFAQALSKLHQEGLLDPQNRALLQAHNDPYLLAVALVHLSQAHLLDDANRIAVAGHPNPLKLAECLIILRDSLLLDDTNREVLKGAPRLEEFVFRLKEFQKFHLLSTPYFQALARHPLRGNLIDAWKTLYYAHLLDDANKDAVASSSQPSDLANIFILLHKNNLDLDINRLAAHGSPSKLMKALTTLTQARLLNETNLEKLIDHPNPEGLAESWKLLQTVLTKNHLMDGFGQSSLFIQLYSKAYNPERFPTEATWESLVKEIIEKDRQERIRRLDLRKPLAHRSL